AIAVPGGGAVECDLALCAGALERLEGRANAGKERGAVDLAELCLGVVNVIGVDRFEAEVRAAALELAKKIARRHAVAAGHEVVPGEDPAADVMLLDVGARIARAAAIEAEKAALGRHEDLLASRDATRERLAKSGTDHALAALVAIVDRAIEDVDP